MISKNSTETIAALELRERLIEYAANTKDHTLSDKFVQLLQLRLPQWTQDGTLKQLLQQHEQKARSLDLVAQFLEQVDAKIKREKELHLTVETIESSLSIYTPFPVLITVDTPTDQDVIRLAQMSAQLAREHTQSAEFIQRVRDFARAIEKTHKYKLPILCFLDEVERIIPTTEDNREKAEEFNACFGALRVLCQEQRQMSLLIADVHPDCNRINSWSQKGVATNPVFSFFKEIFLPPFEDLVVPILFG